MAKLEIIETGTSHIKVKVSGFDETYDETVRNILFLIKETDTDTNYTLVRNTIIPASFGGAFEHNFSSLTESTEYSIRIVITNIKGSSDQYMETTEWTNDPTPKILKFNCFLSESESKGENYFDLRCSFKIGNTSIFGNTSYKFFWRKKGGSAWVEFVTGDTIKKKIDDSLGGAKGVFVGAVYSEEETPAFDFKLKVAVNDNEAQATTFDICYERNRIRNFSVDSIAYYSSGFGEIMYYTYASFDVVGSKSEGEVSYNMVDANGELITYYDSEPEQLENLKDEENGRYIISHYGNLFDYAEPFKCTITINFYDREDSASCEFGYAEYIPFIEELTCEQKVQGEKVVTVSFNVDYITSGESTYQIWASQEGGELWCKAQGKLNGEQNEINVSVDNYGKYEFVLYVFNGDLYSTRRQSVELVEIDKPEPWNWESPMSDGYLELDTNFEVHPVTYKEWNDFLDRINQERVWLGNGSEYVSTGSYLFSHEAVPRGEFTPQMYNEAVAAIRGIAGGGYAGGNLSEIDSDTELSASLFIILRDELNAAIDNL